jgi:hypothetical protein
LRAELVAPPDPEGLDGARPACYWDGMKKHGLICIICITG